ncbi:putative cysteine-rich receptor-like protein kinase 35 [Hirschfeldia incana]|nr:putative cysteine-rich receptor-like protein kinase 35 [Hirschfeldia incana]
MKLTAYQTVTVQVGDEIIPLNSLQFKFKTIEAAADKFSVNNMIGQGGFGEVYMGKLSSGTEVGVKRLSKTSRQGAKEFKNEALLGTKLQHRNLVRLLGFCVEGEEKILAYEFVPNKSLDYFLFDPTKQSELDWTKRYNIIKGITRGLQYLHYDSHPTIIHHNLKTINILLDSDMNPKICDFGTARSFGPDQSKANTKTIVGTYGYMSPEYAMRGHFSMKSDVYSFGVLVLEIISGKMNSSFYHIDDADSNLVVHAWRLWRNESPLKLVDPAMGESYQNHEAVRCIHIALLCIQEDPADRPTLPATILMLTNGITTLPLPRTRRFCLSSMGDFASEHTHSFISDAGIGDSDLP